MKTLIKDAYVLLPDGTTPRTNILIAGDKIQAIGDVPEDFRPAKVIDGRNHLAVPGFVNAHTHASMTLLRSYADDMNLMDWLNNKVWPVEAKMNEDDIYWGAMLAAVEMIEGARRRLPICTGRIWIRLPRSSLIPACAVYSAAASSAWLRTASRSSRRTLPFTKISMGLQMDASPSCSARTRRIRARRHSSRKWRLPRSHSVPRSTSTCMRRRPRSRVRSRNTASARLLGGGDGPL